MDDRMEPLRTASDLDRALSEARGLMERLHDGGPEEERRFEALLQRIVEFHEAQDTEARTAHQDALSEFDRHLQAYGRRWPKHPNPDRTGHWSPMLGGDIRPPGDHNG